MKVSELEAHREEIRVALAGGDSYRAIGARLDTDKETIGKFVKTHFPDLVHGPRRSRPVGDNGLPRFNTLIIDIETRPNLAYIWEVWNYNTPPEHILDEKEVISFAAKWLDDDDIMFHSVFHDGKAEMVEAAWHLLDSADVVIGYNSKGFDVKHLNLEFARLGYPPPSTFRQVDLLQTVRREFKFVSNRLQHVADKLGIGRKKEHEGFALWRKTMQGDPDAWERMKAYNVQDVRLTEQLYLRVLPWITNHPSHAALSGERVCTNCGYGRLKPDGWHYTSTGAFHRFRCLRCGKSLRDTHRSGSTTIRDTSSW